MRLQNEKKFDFSDLFIFEIANNHQGVREHGLRIVDAMADIAERTLVRAAIKLQFRDLDTLIHPDHRENKENKHISRFLSTRLSEEEFALIIHEVKRRNLITICTPFDEASVDKIERMGIEVIKIGSCSAQDWPLLERVAETDKPVICSTGGLRFREIDKIVSFFQHRGVHFALMHCVSMYPTSNDKLHLNQIEAMRNRYPGIPIGFSTHEDPSNMNAVRVAYAKGARIFEKHVGIATDDIKLNTYSATPEQVQDWISAYKEARDACGEEGERPIEEKEKSDLISLARGVYVRKEIKAGTAIKRSDVFFAMPLMSGQLASGEWRENLASDQDYGISQPIRRDLLPRHNPGSKKEIIYTTIHAVKGMLNEARIPLGHDFSVELSHHYGIERFYEVGCTIIECINREYAKKIIIQLSGQWNPVHYHKKKDETFHILQGELEVEVEGRKKILLPGDTFWVPRGVWHGFGTRTGAIFEEISTKDHNDDSFYIDRAIMRMNREDRKTRLVNWGRHQFDEAEGEISSSALLTSL